MNEEMEASRASNKHFDDDDWESHEVNPTL